MKKKIKLSIFLVLSFLLFLVAFSGCGNSLTEQQVESYKQLSETCFSNLQQGNYQEARRHAGDSATQRTHYYGLIF